MKKIGSSKRSKKPHLFILKEAKEEGFKEGVQQKEVFYNSSFKRFKEDDEDKEGSEKMLKKIIRGMLKQKLNLSLIAKVTHLSEKEVVELSKSL